MANTGTFGSSRLSPFGGGAVNLDQLYTLATQAAASAGAQAPIPQPVDQGAAVDPGVASWLGQFNLTPEQLANIQAAVGGAQRTTGAHYTPAPAEDPMIRSFIDAATAAAAAGQTEMVLPSGERWAVNPETIAMAQQNLANDLNARWYAADAQAYSPIQTGLMDAGVQVADGPGSTRPAAPVRTVNPSVAAVQSNPGNAKANAVVSASQAYQNYIASNQGSSPEEYRLRQQAAKDRGAAALKSFYGAIAAGKTF